MLKIADFIDRKRFSCYNYYNREEKNLNEIDLKNNELYLDLVKKVWGMDEKSLSYIEKRLSADWKLVPEFQKILDEHNSKDQRVRFDINVEDESLRGFIEELDRGFTLFKQYFHNALLFLKDREKVDVTYTNYSENKIIYKKNPTKLKKVLERIYLDETPIAFADLDLSYSKFVEEKNIENYKVEINKKIVSYYEIIGKYKKPKQSLQIVFSFNPIDWLLCSTSSAYFGSCLDIQKAKNDHTYKYWIGLPFLCGDPNRVMVYVNSGIKKKFMGIEVDDCLSRIWGVLDKNDLMSLIKWYPNDFVSSSILKKVTGIENLNPNLGSLTGGKYPIDMLFLEDQSWFSIYNDFGLYDYKNGNLWLSSNRENHGTEAGFQAFHSSGCEMLSANERLSSVTKKVDWKVSFFLENNFRFVDLHNLKTCSKCGKKSLGKNVIANGNWNEHICYDCYKENVVKCEVCGKEKYSTDKYRSVKVEIDGEVKEYQACDECLMGLKKCEICGEPYLFDTENKVCNNCRIENGYHECCQCHEEFKELKISKDLLTNEYGRYCENCYDAKKTRDEEENLEFYFFDTNEGNKRFEREFIGAHKIMAV
jgi:hypothetical protein